MKDLITIACLALAVSFAPTFSAAGERNADDNGPSTHGSANEDTNAMDKSSTSDSSAMDRQMDSDTDRSSPSTFVKDSAITAKVKAKLMSEHISSLANIQVDTDANGIVWLSGTVRTQTEADQAVAMAKSTEGVVNVKNNLRVQS